MTQRMTRTHRLATEDDLPAIAALMDRAIEALQAGFLSPAQISASRAGMGLDTQLIADRTYFLVEDDDVLVGCGGWSRRATLYGGDAAAVRDASLLDPARDPARIRAMYTDPDRVRQGIGRAVLTLCEDAARAAGFARTQLMATRAGEPLYRASGYEVVERVDSFVPGEVAVPGAVMVKPL
ncbi:GNAT family N-acetyltransferase [Sphingomonas sp.]|uniref:GNAT family N-acetyltransferase n=1 Tax=Sphingomonas sp. TaxID=28214 RepID=UPI003AFFF30E